ncbi:MAG: hypothetical protein DLM60_09310 [Pseudonocardiales bacterium]|nr:MAG: hypothetical protein DLM60_09310 [Pseudonocardiales bacterium]
MWTPGGAGAAGVVDFTVHDETPCRRSGVPQLCLIVWQGFELGDVGLLGGALLALRPWAFGLVWDGWR